MAVLDHPRREKFAQLYASGRSAAEACRLAGYSEKGADKTAWRLARNPEVAARVAELQQAQADKAEMGRDDLRRYLIEVLVTPAGEVDRSHRLCQGFKDTERVVETKMPDKLAAAAQLARLCGWNEPEKVDHGAEGLAELLKLIRHGR